MQLQCKKYVLFIKTNGCKYVCCKIKILYTYFYFVQFFTLPICFVQNIVMKYSINILEREITYLQFNIRAETL